MKVSVPLRGLDMRKPDTHSDYGRTSRKVSVPLRGLDMRKLPLLFSIVGIARFCFSPLAGIRYAETMFEQAIALRTMGFSSLAGIRYAET